MTCCASKSVHSWEDCGLHIPEILLPAEGIDSEKWSVVACDQYTSEPEYWAQVEKLVGDAPSTLRLVLPEVFLGADDEAARIASIRKSMTDYLENGTLRKLEPGCMLVRRTAQGRSRLGLVIATDLEAYDFSVGSTSPTRATEGTVIERIPPRLRIREGAPLELPHILILIDDPARSVIEPLVDAPQTLMYDTDLMMEGGHITGSFIAEEHLEGARKALSVLLDAALAEGGTGILQAMGDGNHSLATAKTAWENLKKTLTPEEAAVHPARYALCEIENIHDEGIVFEPIHRVAFAAEGTSALQLIQDFIFLMDKQNGSAVLKNQKPQSCCCCSQKPQFVFPVMWTGEEGLTKAFIEVTDPCHTLEVGVLQNAIDELVEAGSCTVDYIHGEATVESLTSKPGAIGFLLPSMDKSSLFPAVATDGALPRKTFSMGEANEKRFYLEARSLV